MKNNNQTNALSLFDGMSCFQIALKELNIPIDNYYASEVDKHAINQTKHAFPNTIHLGDVRDIDVTKLPYISILGGGSPCQSFSFAGKMKGMSTKQNIKILELDHYLELKSKNFEFEGQSYLFWEYMRILRDIQKYNPDVEYLLENVVMTKEWELILSRAIGINPIMINAALVSAQNRKRLFWTNIYNQNDGMFGDPVCMIPQPKDRGILLKDILETTVDEKYFLSDKMVNVITKGGAIDTLDNDKSATLLTSYHKMGGRDQQYVNDFQGMDINKKARTLRVGGSQSQDDKHNFDLIKIDKQGNVKQNQDKTSCLDTGTTNAIELFGCIKFGRTDEAKEMRKESMKKGKDYTPFQAKEITGIDYDKMNTLTTVIHKDNLVMQINPSKESNNKQPFQQNRIYDSEGISPSLCANKADLIIQIPEATKKGYVEIQPGECFDLEHPDSSTRRGRKMTDKSNTLMASETKFMQLTKDFRIRRLTPLECSRLQSIPHWYTWGNTSDTQTYRMLGNGWNIEVIKHIISYSNLIKK